MTSIEIANIIQKLCGTRYSKQTISNIADKALESIEPFKNALLIKSMQSCFLVIHQCHLEVTGLKIERSKDTQKYTKLLTLSLYLKGLMKKAQ